MLLLALWRRGDRLLGEPGKTPVPHGLALSALPPRGRGPQPWAACTPSHPRPLSHQKGEGQHCPAGPWVWLEGRDHGWPGVYVSQLGWGFLRHESLLRAADGVWGGSTPREPYRMGFRLQAQGCSGRPRPAHTRSTTPVVVANYTQFGVHRPAGAGGNTRPQLCPRPTGSHEALPTRFRGREPWAVMGPTLQAVPHLFPA